MTYLIHPLYSVITNHRFWRRLLVPLSYRVIVTSYYHRELVSVGVLFLVWCRMQNLRMERDALGLCLFLCLFGSHRSLSHIRCSDFCYSSLSSELARRGRQKRRKVQTWVWGSIFATITLGSTALAWSYLNAKGSSSSHELHASEPDTSTE